jgi:hypothetical protein
VVENREEFKMVQNDNEQLLSVKSIVNNTLLDFTILEVTTNKRTYNVSLEFEPVFTKTYGMIYNYKQSLDDWLKENNIKTDIYNYSDNKDTIPRNEHNPIQTTGIFVFNSI